jgi:hypothetical protein
VRYCADDIPAVEGVGVYAFFVCASGVLGGLKVQADSPIYVGKTNNSLNARNGFVTAIRACGLGRGFSKPRHE